MKWKNVTESSWGNTTQLDVKAGRPERLRDVVDYIQQSSKLETHLIAVGSRKSYGDACLNENAHVLLMERMNRILNFDNNTGDVTCEPGVTFHDLFDTFLERGFMPPVTPGTGYVTIGGAVTNDVHGKNHDKMGSFGNHIKWIEMIDSSGKTIRASSRTNTDLFRATIGGLGLTGIITSVCFTMQKIPHNAVLVRYKRMKNIGEYVNRLIESRGKYEFSVGWVDMTARGKSLGRGILEEANFADSDITYKRPQGKAVPKIIPGFAINKLTTKIFNTRYYKRIPEKGLDKFMPLQKFLYPLDKWQNWNRLYGKKGFYQVQCVVPDKTAEISLSRIIKACKGSASPLAVIKTLGDKTAGMLSFPMKGVTLAIDLPNTSRTENIIKNIHEIVATHGGRVYLAKDGLLDVETFRKMYPNYRDFIKIKDSYDSMNLFSSSMSRRLEL